MREAFGRFGVYPTKAALEKMRAIRSTRGWQREAARLLIATKGGARVEELRRLCKALKCYDAQHFIGYMEGFGRATCCGRVTHFF